MGDIVSELISFLLKDNPEGEYYAKQALKGEKYKKALLNVLLTIERNPARLPEEFFNLQDLYIQENLYEKGRVSPFSLPATKIPNVCLWKGDITRLEVDCVACPADPELEGSFVPGLVCVDNKIHLGAGLELRRKIIEAKKKIKQSINPGFSLLTEGYNLPAKYIIHVVPPYVGFRPTNQDILALHKCYENVFKWMRLKSFKTVAIPLLGTGRFNFPLKKAADISLSEIKRYFQMYGKDDIEENPIIILVTDSEEEHNVYREILEDKEDVAF